VPDEDAKALLRIIESGSVTPEKKVPTSRHPRSFQSIERIAMRDVPIYRGIEYGAILGRDIDWDMRSDRV